MHFTPEEPTDYHRDHGTETADDERVAVPQRIGNVMVGDEVQPDMNERIRDEQRGSSRLVTSKASD
jgi:hypothetical protein